jgi:hypothetical protein
MQNTIKQFLNFIKRFPTGDNCQCWSFTVTGNKIKAEHCHETAEHSFNSSNVASLISLGFLLEYIEGAKEALKIDCDVKIDGLDLEINVLSETEVQSVCSSNVYLTRNTDRRTYDSELTKKETQELEESFSNITVVNYNKQSSTIKKMILSREKFLWLSHKFYYDFIKWVRFTKSEYEKKKDGMRPAHLHVTPDVTCLLWIFKHSPLALKLFIKSPLYIPLKLTTQGFYKKSHLIIVEAEDLSDNSILNAARKIMRVWIHQESKGHSLQPMNISVLPYIDKIRSKIEVTQNENVLNEFKKQLYLKGLPVWVFRVGKNKKPSKCRPTLRK